MSVAVDRAVQTVIDRPVAEVAAYAGDPTDAPSWYANIRTVDGRTSPPIGVGSRMDLVARFLGRTLADTYEVTELAPEAPLMSLAMRRAMAKNVAALKRLLEA